ncbi:MAG: TolB family protein [Anaerolineaceae bacterium]
MKKNILRSLIIIFLLNSITGCETSQAISSTIVTSQNATSTPIKILTSTETITPAVTPSQISTPMGGSSKVVVDNRKCNDLDVCFPSIYLYDLISDQRTLILSGYFLEGISPEGSRLLVSTSTEKPDLIEQRSLFVVNLDGSNLRLLSSNYKYSYKTGVQNVYWFDKEDVIVFIEMDGIGLIRPDGTGYKRIDTSNTQVETFLPFLENNKIYWREEFPYPHDGGWYISRIDTSWIRKIDGFNEPTISQDGKSVAYLYDDDRQLFVSDSNYPLGKVWNIANVVDFAQYIMKSEGKTLNNYIRVGFMPPIWLPDSKNLITMLYMISRDCTKCSSTKNFSQPFIISTTGEVIALNKLTGYFEPEYFFGGYSYSPDRRLIIYLFVEEIVKDINTETFKALDLNTMEFKSIKTDFKVDEGENAFPFSIYWIP